jgi:hypothetical protein
MRNVAWYIDKIAEVWLKEQKKTTWMKEVLNGEERKRLVQARWHPCGFGYGAVNPGMRRGHTGSGHVL